MEMLKVIGIQESKFTPKDDPNTVIKGTTIYAEFERKNVDGMACDRFFVSEARMDGLKIKVGDTIGLSYNRYGKVESVIVIESAA